MSAHLVLEKIEAVREKLTSQEYRDLVDSLSSYRESASAFDLEMDIKEQALMINKSLVLDMHQLFLQHLEEMAPAVIYAVSSTFDDLMSTLRSTTIDNTSASYRKRHLLGLFTEIRTDRNTNENDDPDVRCACAMNALHSTDALYALLSLIDEMRFLKM